MKKLLSVADRFLRKLGSYGCECENIRCPHGENQCPNKDATNNIDFGLSVCDECYKTHRGLSPYDRKYEPVSAEERIEAMGREEANGLLNKMYLIELRSRDPDHVRNMENWKKLKGILAAKSKPAPMPDWEIEDWETEDLTEEELARLPK